MQNDKHNGISNNIFFNDIVFVIYSAFPQKAGGRETWIDGISKNLVEKGCNVTIYSLKQNNIDNTYYDSKNTEKLRIIRMPSMLSLSLSRWFISQSRFKYLHYVNMIIFNILVNIHIRLCHKKNHVIVLQKLGLEAMIGHLPKKTKKIVAFTHGDLIYETKKQFPHPWAVRLMEIAEQYTANRMDSIFFTHQNEMKTYFDRSKIDKANCAVLYNGIDISDFKFLSPSMRIKTRRDLGIKESVKIFTNVATIHEIKGHIYLIKAISELLPEYKCMAKFVFVGGGNTNYLLKIAKEYNVDDNIMVLGQLKQDDVFKTLNASDAFMMPSLKEGLPISLLEAMGCGLPVIASIVGGIPEVVMEDGILVQPMDSEELKDAIIKMLVNYDFYFHKAETAKRRILYQHNWDTITDKFLDSINLT